MFADIQHSLLAAAYEAMGGYRELDKIHSITAIANCTSPRGPYITEIHSARNDRLLFRQQRPDGSFFEGFTNGRFAWFQNPETGQIESLDEASKAMIRSHEFQMLPLVLPERYHRLRLNGQAVFADILCQKVDMVDELGLSGTLYFSSHTHLLTGMTVGNSGDNGRSTVQITFDEWRQVAQVKLPGRVTATDSTGEYVLDFHTILLNQADEALFAIPENKILA